MLSLADTGNISPNIPVFSIAFNSSLLTIVYGLELESVRSSYNTSGEEYHSSILYLSVSVIISDFDSKLSFGSWNLNWTMDPSVIVDMNPFGDLHMDGSNR